MRNKPIVLTLVIMLVIMNIQAQKESPFDVKKKSVTGQSVIPSNDIKAIPANSSGLQTAPAHYHSIPFLPINSNGTQSFSNPSFNKKGQLIFLAGNNKSGISFNQNNPKSIEDAAFDYLGSIRYLIGIDNPTEEFKTIESHTDKYGITHIKLQQYFNDLKVYRGQVFVHGENNLMTKFNGEYFPTPVIEDLVPDIGVDFAYEVAKDHIMVPIIEPTPFEKSLVDFKSVVPELVLYHPDFMSNEVKLTWHLTFRPNFLRRFEYFIDANTGEILNYYNHTCSDGPTTAQATDLNGNIHTIHTYLLNGSYYLIDASRSMFNATQSELPDNPVGAIWTIDANNSSGSTISHFANTTNAWDNVPEGVSAHHNAGETYEYFLDTHGRNSINGQGGTIISICNVTNEDGSSMENAFWNGQAMFYGNGGNVFSPLAGALDVGSHEMAHGVVQNTCNLEYQGESGALNESMADIAGCMVDREDWFLGEDVVINTNLYPTGNLRDMSNPHNGGSSLNDPCFQPEHTDEQYHGSEDNGGVHINSGIMNYCYYKFATQIGKDNAELIYYKSMTDYLVKSSQFVDARVAFVQAATDIYGSGSNEVNAVENAFTEVGIGEGGGGNPGQGNLQVNPGDDFILSVDVNPADPNTLYISTTDATAFEAISTTQLLQKPSIVDNGSVAVFVTPQNRIKFIDLNTYEEDFIASDAVYDNIAVSKDGSRLAVISTSIDSAIWVYDYGLTQWAKFHLYNPTFTPGVVTENVLYADAIEWDYSGEYIIYDAYNKLQNASGEDIDYWDMGIIKVWDNVSGFWGDGKIEKVFTNLPEGVSVGNPSLAKNSPYILTFDYLDVNTGEMNVMAANLETGEIGLIFQNVVLGYPNYSKHDDKIIFNANTNGGDEIVAEIGLQSNKIQPSGDAIGLINYAKWGIWYSTGERELFGVEEEKVNRFTMYPNPVSENVLNVLFSESSKEKSSIKIINTLGQIVLERNVAKNELLLQIDVSSLVKGNYIIQWTDNKQNQTKKLIKL